LPEKSKALISEKPVFFFRGLLCLTLLEKIREKIGNIEGVSIF
jgi:hypothetical protein